MNSSRRLSTSQFLQNISPSAMFELEEHDDELACLSKGAACLDHTSSALSVNTTRTASLSISTHTNGSSTVCSYERNELTHLGNVGSGAYCKVAKVTHGFGPEVLAQKSIDACRLRSRYDLNCAAAELANEAKILSMLDHENIIKLRGVSSERFSESFVSGNGGYFLLMDILNETLRDRLNKQIKMEKQESRLASKRRSLTNFLKRFNGSSVSRNEMIQECQSLYNRIEDTVLGLARGMMYLHSKNIVLRDLKPDNIGYENSMDGADENFQEGTVKIFDFGMASKVDECDPKEICGSPRYMAPEVMVGNGYTLAVDVYSFGIVLYELCSLKRPFEESFQKAKRKTTRRSARGKKVMINKFCDMIINEEIKPAENLERDVCCPKLRGLIEACWDRDPSKRPTFDEILPQLVDIFYSDLCADLFVDHNSDQVNTSHHTRDYTGKRSAVSIEFEDGFTFSENDEASENKDTQSFP